MRASLVLCCLLLSCAAACQQPDPSAPPAAPSAAVYKPAPGEVATLDLVALKAAGKLDALEVVEAEVAQDPAYHKAMRYRGWRLDDVLALIPELKTLDATQHELRLIALDGYTVTWPLAELTGGAGVIAFEDKAQPDGKEWSSFMQGKREVTPAPFYLVWDKTPYGPQRPWPYQLARISVLATATAYGKAYPGHLAADAQVMVGFGVYKQRCMSCHSVNLSGGELGPELNVPRNITEYWSEEHLRGLIKNPRAYRARSVMPAFPDLSDADVDALLTYLRAMMGAKVCDSAEACEAL